MWGDRRARLVDCIAQKNCAMHNDKWEKQFTEFERCVAMSGRVIKILGNGISWAQEAVVWKLGFRRRLQRMKGVWYHVG